jgi:hypothetical protein
MEQGSIIVERRLVRASTEKERQTERMFIPFSLHARDDPRHLFYPFITTIFTVDECYSS